jgi:hypothetical protein
VLRVCTHACANFETSFTMQAVEARCSSMPRSRD